MEKLFALREVFSRLDLLLALTDIHRVNVIERIHITIVRVSKEFIIIPKPRFI